jgi:hypothetical protein
MTGALLTPVWIWPGVRPELAGKAIANRQDRLQDYDAEATADNDCTGERAKRDEPEDRPAGQANRAGSPPLRPVALIEGTGVRRESRTAAGHD